MNKRHRQAIFLRGAVYTAAILVVALLLAVVGYILYQGVPHLTPQLFSLQYTSDNVSMMPALINTLLMTAVALLIAVPLGIGAAIYLAEYTGKGNKLVAVIVLATETLAGIPSIVYGLFGLLFFVTTMGFGMSLLAGALTLSIMVLPTITRTAQEALQAVSDDYRQGSFGLGAGRLRTTMRVVLPAAMPGILSGIILAVGRIVGESAALLYTAGTVAKVPISVLSSARTLSVHMYLLSSEGLHVEQTYATAVVLLLLVFGVNALAAYVAKKVSRGRSGETT